MFQVNCNNFLPIDFDSESSESGYEFGLSDDEKLEAITIE